MRGHVRPATSGEKGKWQLFLELPRLADGKRRQKCITFHGTKKQAEAELTRLVNEVNEKKYVAPAKKTLAVFMREWLEVAVQGTVKPKTYEGYEDILRAHIERAPIGALPLEQLESSHLVRFYAEKRKTRSDQTVLNIHRAIHAALAWGVRLKALRENVAALERQDRPKVSKQTRPTYDPEQIACFLEKAKGRSIYPAAVLGVMTGMRLGEILALKWSDIDFERGRALIDESLSYTRKEGIHFKTPKNGKVERVPLGEGALEFLREHQETQDARRRLLGEAYQDQGLIYPNDDGTPRNLKAVSRQWNRFIHTTDLPPIRFHDLRHSCAGLLMDGESNLAVVQAQLRHGSMATTMDNYGHLTQGTHRDAINRLDDRLRKAMQPPPAP